MKFYDIEKKYGFTLAETLIVMCILGVLAVLLLVNVQRATPDKNKAMFKKAFSVAQRAINDIAADESLYPFDPKKIKLVNTEEVGIPSTSIVTSRGEITKIGGKLKLCTLFADRLNLASKLFYTDDGCYFETTDGVAWFVPVLGDEASCTIDAYHTCGVGQKAVIVVDVDGLKRGPNKPNYGSLGACSSSPSDYSGFCYSSSGINNPNKLTSLNSNEKNLPNRDRFAIIINVDGNVSVRQGELEDEYLRADKLNKDNNN